MLIRPLTPGDVSEAATVYVRSWQSAYRGIVPQTYLDNLSAGHWADGLLSPPRTSFGLWDGGRCVATASVGAARCASMAGWGELISLYVLPDCFRQGYGRALLLHATGFLSRQGMNRIYLWVLEDNRRARAFYEANGFAPTDDTAALQIEGKTLWERKYIKQIL